MNNRRSPLSLRFNHEEDQQQSKHYLPDGDQSLYVTATNNNLSRWPNLSGTNVYIQNIKSSCCITFLRHEFRKKHQHRFRRDLVYTTGILSFMERVVQLYKAVDQ